MMLRPMVWDGGGQVRQLAPGDVLAGGEVIPATVVTTNITVTGQQLLNGFILRNPAAPATDTLDTAANIVAAMQGAYGNIPNGTTMRVRWIVTTANATTVAATANTGVTVTRGAIAASSCKEFLLTIVNGAPAQTFTGMTTNASAIVTGMTAAQTALLSPNMIVTNAVNGLQGAKVLSVQPGIGVTLDTNANSTSVLPGVSISFSPQVLLEGIGASLI